MYRIESQERYELRKELTELLENNHFEIVKSRLETLFGTIERHKIEKNITKKTFLDLGIIPLQLLYVKTLYKLSLFGTGLKLLQAIEKDTYQLWTEQNEKTDLILDLYCNIAYGFLQIKDYDNSFIYAKKVVSICKNIFYPEYLLPAIDILIMKLIKDKNFIEIEKYFKEVDVIYDNIAVINQQHIYKMLKIILMTKRADIAMVRDEDTEALSWLKKASVMASDIDNNKNKSHYLEMLSCILQSFINLAEKKGYKKIEDIQAFILNESGISFKI